MEISENSRKVLERRYLKKGADGEPDETVEDMFWRVSRNIALAEKLYDEGADTRAVALEFYKIMASLEFLPNSPTLMNAGRDLQQLSACFVLPIEDSMESIFEAVKNTALIHKSGGGTGFSFSKLRPSGDTVGSTSGISSGPISFMTVFDGATEAIKQGGTRRGANMGILRVDHPDIMDFISCKADNNKLNNFNISVSLTENFMTALETGSDYELINPKDGTAVDTLNSTEVFDKIVQMAWKNGDPGIIFLDRINAENPTPQAGPIESTNPCGEQPLLAYESCNLGSINLSRMVKRRAGKGKSGKTTFELDEAKLTRTVKKAVHFLDNVIDMNSYPIEQIATTTRSNRKIGLGVMGFADLLIMLGIPYDSDEAITMADRVMGLIQEEGHKASADLAFKRGVFPNYEGSMYEAKDEPIRNATITTIAPTGTISIISSCSSGIEPLFALAYTRTVMDGTALLEVNPIFKEIAEARGFDSEEIMQEVAEKGSLHDIEGIPEDIKRIFVTSHDITPEWHIKMQGVFQKHTDNAVSKTVNFPNEATVEDVAKVYTLAYKLGCKGVTVYRDGSRDVQVLTRGKDTPASEIETIDEQQPPIMPTVRPRGELAFGITKKIKTGCGNLYVTINEDEEGRPIEIFTQIGKAGGCVASQCEAMGRMTSLALRSGVDAQEIIKQMRGISCHLPVGFGADKVTSCSDAMAKAMEWYILFKMNRENSPLHQGQTINLAGTVEGRSSMQGTLTVFNRGACPDCGGSVEHADGCVVCRGCGYTECG
ncbi:MAG: vitamin B12-dependent ribonucleotide reductase [Thermodesulfobacteriota bacterium]